VGEGEQVRSAADWGGTMPFWRGLNGATNDDLAVDLGTANTVVYRRGQGVVVFEPSVVALDERTGSVHAIGEQASRMIGRTPAAIRATRPLRHGVIADFEVTEQMLRYFVGHAGLGRLANPRVIVCVPSGITEVERRAIEEATLAAGARRAYLIEEPMAGAIGAGLPVAEPRGSLVVDIGGGTSEIAVIALGGMVVATSLRVGGYELDDAIVRFAQQEHKLLIGQQQAEQAKIALASAHPQDDDDESAVEVAGRDLVTGLLRRQALTAREVRTAIARPLAQIVDAVKDTLERTPPELASDVADRGIVLVGGGALLRGIDQRLRQETQLAVSIAESPLTCVAVGAGLSLEEIGALERVRSSADRSSGTRSRRRSRRRFGARSRR
jgi:rod shape-determining protein MreB and related proteins